MSEASDYTVQIEGMSYASCMGRAEAALKDADGVSSASVNLASASTVIKGEG
ncbi:MAG: hypothetical protein HKN63_03720 [Rhodobacteraceae bacterium]|nr:hypothetical protein [Paracoccaceae bacterium]